jgi:hypothetical protein
MMWPGVRAALIALAISAGLIDGCPVPRAHGSAARAVVRSLVSAQQTALRPLEPLRAVVGVHQRWLLFPAADPRPWRMVVDARDAAGRWTILYRAQDDEHAFASDAIEYRRLRGTWDPSVGGAPRAYGAFASWLALRAFERFPAAVEVRIRMQRLRVLSRGAGAAATDVYAFEQRRSRGEP